jgi:ABC-type nitrate/sulfonate/bicarbonate transport system substrate-binding protein
MSELLDRRLFLRRAAAATGWGFALPLFVACAPAGAPSPTTPAEPVKEKPTEAAKPTAAPAGQPAAPAATSAPAAQAAVKKVSYGIVSSNPFHWQILVGVEKPEFMRRHGVEIDLLMTGSSPAAVQALVGGSMNMATATPESVWPAQDKTPDVFQVIAISHGTPYSLIVNPEVRKIEDLKGKPLGATAVRGGADTTALRSMLFENGLKDTDYTVVPVGSVAERTAAMRASSVMAVAQLEPQTSQLKENGFVELDNADNYPPLKNLLTLTVAAKKDWYEGSMDTAAAFVKGWIDIVKWIYDPNNRGEAIDILARAMKIDAALTANAYERHVVNSKTLPLDPHVDAALMQNTAENQRRIGTENVPAEVGKYIDNSIVDRAMA